MSGQIPPVNPAVIIQPISTSPTTPDSGQIPNAFTNLPTGTLVEGFVVNRNLNQQPILRTSLGDILVQSELFLKTGSEVVLRIDPSAAGRARIVTVDGANPQDYAQQLASRTITKDTILPSSLTATQTATPTANTPAGQVIAPLLRAILLQPPASSLPASSAAPVANASPLAAPTPHAVQTSYVLPNGRTLTLAPTVITEELAKIASQSSFEIRVISSTVSQSSATPPSPTANNALAASPENAEAAALAKTPTASNAALPSTPTAATNASAPSSNATLGDSVNAAIATKPSAIGVSASAPSPLTSATIAAQPNVSPPPMVSPTTTPNAGSVPAAPTAALATTQTLPQNTGSAVALAPPSVPSTAPQAPIISQWHIPVALQNSANLSNAIPATVIGHEQDGGTVLQSPVGQMKVFTAQPLPNGAQLLFTIDAKPIPAAPSAISWLPAAFSEIVPLLNDWQSLEDALASVMRTQPQLVHDVMTRAIAQPDNKITTSMLFFLSAVKGGDIRQLLGRNFMEILENDSPALAKKLASDFGQLHQAMREPVLQNWSMFILPMHYEREFNQLRLYVRHDDASDDKKSIATGQRFVLDMTLSHLGDMQLDGFIRKLDTNKHFDLVLRTATHWPPELQQQVRGIYEAALGATGMRGAMQIQVGAQFFARPLQEAHENTINSTQQSGVIA
jgi:hypothetical protein